jgi:hypothetical protein
MPQAYDTTGIEYFTIPNFIFASGATCDIRVAYHSFNPGSKKTALIPTCMFSGSTFLSLREYYKRISSSDIAPFQNRFS